MSLSIHVDHTNENIKKYLDNKIKLSDDEPALYYDHYDPEALQDIIDTQRKMIEHQNKQKHSTHLFQILIVVDDFADDPVFSRSSK